MLTARITPPNGGEDCPATAQHLFVVLCMSNFIAMALLGIEVRLNIINCTDGYLLWPECNMEES